MASGPLQPHTSDSPELDSLFHSLGGLVSSKSLFAKQLLRFAAAGDDDDIQHYFAGHAQEIDVQVSSLQKCFASLTASQTAKSVDHFSWVSADGMNSLSAASVPEEQTLHHILVAYTASTGFVALSEITAAFALSGGDRELAVLVRTVQSQDRRAVEKYWHFLSTRTKLAYNMLTLSEIDPAVETKVADDRLLS